MNKTFTSYDVFLIAVLTLIQFTLIVDFMVLSPLSAILLPELRITTSQFGMVVSAYAWSAGVSALVAAGFADKYDRKKLLLFFYAGFILGTFLCGIADDYIFLLIARIVTGIFGGVIGSVVYTIVSDHFVLSVRGSVMGFLQMAFAGASVLGLPIGVYLANELNWHWAFLMIVILCAVILLLLILFMKPVNAHLSDRPKHHPFSHLSRTISNPEYIKAFASTILLGTAGFMLMPFGSAFAVNNNGISVNDLPLLYSITGVAGMVIAPLLGKLSDAVGKLIVFTICSALLIVSAVTYCNLEVTPFWIVCVFSIVLFVTYAGRMVSSSALMTAVPDAADRGAFMSVNSSVNMVSGGIASIIAGAIVFQTPAGRIENYDILGYVVAAACLITMAMMYVIDRMVKEKTLTRDVSVQAE
jgi:predicted MFS family arabinose efflux permease